MFQQADLEETLQGIPWFLELQQKQINQLANISKLVQLAPGQDLFAEGGKQDFLFILLEGEIELTLYVPMCGEQHVFTAEPLDVLGWDQLTPVIRQRFGSAHATKPSLLVAIAGEAMRCLAEEDHELGFFVYRRLANVVASRMLNIRLAMTDAIVKRCGNE